MTLITIPKKKPKLDTVPIVQVEKALKSKAERAAEVDAKAKKIVEQITAKIKAEAIAELALAVPTALDADTVVAEMQPHFDKLFEIGKPATKLIVFQDNGSQVHIALACEVDEPNDHLHMYYVASDIAKNLGRNTYAYIWMAKDHASGGLKGMMHAWAGTEGRSVGKETK